MKSVDEVRNEHKEKLEGLLKQHKESSLEEELKSDSPLPRKKPQLPPDHVASDIPPIAGIEDFDDQEEEEKTKVIAHQGDRVEISSDGHVTIIEAEIDELKPSNLMMKCPSCDMHIEKDARVCEYCGASLT